MPATDCGTHLEVSPKLCPTKRECAVATFVLVGANTDGTSGDGTGDAAFAVPGSKARMQAVLDEAAVPERPGERPGERLRRRRICSHPKNQEGTGACSS